jgi:hypothetical protein
MSRALGDLVTVESSEPPYAHHAFVVAGTVGGATSSTLESNLSLGTELLLRLFHINAGVSLDFAKGDGARAGAAFVAGPSFSVGLPLEVEALVTIGTHQYSGVGSSSSGGGLLNAGCGTPGASGDTWFTGARVGLASPVRKAWSFAIAASFYYRVDWTTRTERFRGSCHPGWFERPTPETTRTWEDQRVIGGHEAGLVIRLGGQSGF